MIKTIIVVLVIEIIVLCFVPDRYFPKKKKRKSWFNKWNPDDTGGLPWFANGKRKKK